jgi:serine/threonine-protein kinase HipA
MTDALNVFYNSRPAGRLWLNDRREMNFQYSDQWISDPDAVPLSIRLPLRQESFDEGYARFFFANLLPEGDVRTLIARKIGVSERNDFELLKALGGDCAGALSLWPEEPPAAQDNDYVRLTDKDMEGMISRMAGSPLLTSRDDLRLSLAGAQQKLPVLYKDGELYLPRGNSPSSHILKPSAPAFDFLSENEVFCMALAKKTGLRVPDAQLKIGAFNYALIERYDRRKEPDGRLIRLHQEDFCQALGCGDTQKYESEGGPGLKNCFDLLSEHSTQPALDKQNLVQWVIFNLLIGNCDAHAKNVSMFLARDRYSLTPFYDLVSTRVYPSLSPKLAMKIGGQVRPEWITREHWEKFAKDAQIGMKAVIGALQDMKEKCPALAAELLKEFRPGPDISEALEKICRHMEAASTQLRGSCR